MSRIVEIDPEGIEIPERVLAARMGFKGAGRVPERFRGIFSEMKKAAGTLSKPTASFADYDTVRGDILSVSGVEIPGKLAQSQLGGSSEITAIVVTLGKELDREISRLHDEGSELESFILDSIGSELAEYAARTIDAGIRAEKKLRGSARISPGYADLPLSLNLWFARELGKDIGVVCDAEAYTFVPRKTISAFIGWSR